MNATEAKRLTQSAMKRRSREKEQSQQDYEAEFAYEISIVLKRINELIKERAEDCNSSLYLPNYRLASMVPHHCKETGLGPTGTVSKIDDKFFQGITNKLIDNGFVVQQETGRVLKIRWND